MPRSKLLMIKRHLLYSGIAVCALLAALYLFAFHIIPSTIYSSWIAHPLAIVLVMGFFAFLYAPQPFSFVPPRLLLIFYSGLLLLIGLYLWAFRLNAPPAQPDPKADWGLDVDWVWVSLPILAAVFLPTFARSRFGNWLFQQTFFQGTTVSFISLCLVAMLGEAVIRTERINQHIPGLHILNSAPEYAERRQQWGSMDMPFAQEKPAGVVRVLAIGDSYTYGDGVFAKDRYAGALQKYGGQHLEVVVLAENGLTTQRELEYWRLWGEPVNPDVVIVGVVTNDPDVGRIPQASPVTVRVLTKLFPRSQLAYFLDSRGLFNFLKKEQPSDGLPYSEWERALYTDRIGRRLWEQTVQQFYNEITASGAEAWAYILATPQMRENGAIPAPDPKFAYLEAVFRGAGFHTVNLYPLVNEAFNPESPTQYCAFPNDCHPNAAVHDFYARVMWRNLQARYFPLGLWWNKP